MFTSFNSDKWDFVLNFLFFFFFQAEDGIRDIGVTGVQTCALPISCDPRRRGSQGSGGPRGGAARRRYRSEERRVGKECRSRWSPYHQKKKKQKPVEYSGKRHKQIKTQPRRVAKPTDTRANYAERVT